MAAAMEVLVVNQPATVAIVVESTAMEVGSEATPLSSKIPAAAETSSRNTMRVTMVQPAALLGGNLSLQLSEGKLKSPRHQRRKSRKSIS